jgi:hypothetical protein
MHEHISRHHIKLTNLNSSITNNDNENDFEKKKEENFSSSLANGQIKV